MSQSITEHMVRAYATNIYLKAAQTMSLFEQAVRIESGVVGRMKSFDRLGSGEAVEDTTRHGDTPMHELEHDRRWAVLKDWIFSPMIDDEDKLKMIIDPTSDYVSRASQAQNRKKDDRIIGAFTATTLTGENADGTPETFDTTNQQIAHGSTGMTPTKLRQSMEKLRMADIPEDEDFYIATGPRQIFTDLLNFPELTSADYNSIRTMVEGKIGSFMGFKFIMSNRLSATAVSGGVRSCFAWAKSGMGLAVAKDTSIDIVRRPDKKNNAQVIMKGSMNGVRIEMVKVVEVLCQE